MHRFLVMCLLALTVQSRPESAYRIAKALPNKAARIPKQPNPIDEFQLLPSRSSRLPQIDSVNIVMRGDSFDKDSLPVLEGLSYLVNWPDKVSRDDVVYATGDTTWLQYYVEREMFPIFFLDMHWVDVNGAKRIFVDRPELERLSDNPRVSRIAFCHKAVGHRKMRVGAGLSCVIALGLLAKRVEIYGWDFYSGSVPNEVPYWKALWKMLSHPLHTDSRLVVGAGFYNWHYAYRFSQVASFKNHGYLGRLDRHTGLFSKLERVFYQR